jgi:hypothetical protein
MLKIHIAVGSIVTMFLSWNIHVENSQPLVAPATTVVTTSTMVEVPTIVPASTTTTTSTTTSTTVAEKIGLLSVPSDQEKRCPQFEATFREYKMLPIETWSYIAWRESRCQTKVVGWNYHKGLSHEDCAHRDFERHRNCDAVRSYDIGLLQVNSSWRTVTRRICGGSIERLFDLDCNLRVARWLHANGGFAHWRVAG